MRKIIPYLFAGTLIIVLTKISYNYFRTNSKGENIDKNFEGCDYIEIPTFH